MASSEENPAAAATPSADDKKGSESGEQAQASKRPKKKTLIGLGKLRESLKKSSSGKKSSSLSLPKPDSRRKTTPGLSNGSSDEDDSAESVLTPSHSTPSHSTPSHSTPSHSTPSHSTPSHSTSDEPDTDRIDGSLIDDIELPESALLDEPMEAEATMLSDSPFEGEATMVSESLLDKSDDSKDAFDPGDEFEVEATMVSDSLLGAESSVSEDADQGPPSTPLTHRTNPNPPTPEQKPRIGNFSMPSGSSPNVQVEPTLAEASGATDGDFHAGKTEVFDSPYENEALVARLAVLSGPAAGQQFLLNKQRNTVGRGNNNTIVVADLAMSRQHLEILEQNDKSYLLVDLQAANGTRLNSTRVEEAELMHGDRIEAGKSELQFIIPGSRPQQRTQNRHLIPKREVSTAQSRTMVRQMQSGQGPESEATDKVLTYVIIGAGVLSLLLIGAAIYLFVADSSTPRPVAHVVSSEDPKAQALYLEGVEMVKDRKWDEARELFEKVGKTDPEFAGVAAQLERVSREKRAQQKLEQAESLFEQDKSDEAGELAEQISNQSVYFDQAQSLLRKTRQHRVAQLYEKAQEEVTAENLEQAKSHLAAILEEVPNHEGALELRQTLMSDEEKKEEEEERAAAEREARREERSSRRTSTSNDDWLASSGSRSARATSGGSTRVNFTKGFTLYKSGKFDAATSHFEGAALRSSGAVASRASKTAKNIERFEQTYTRALRAFDAEAWKTSLDSLEQARLADRSVARTGYFKTEIDAHMATTHAKIGLMEFAKGNFASAHRSYARGSKYQRSNPTINTLRRKLSNKARGTYIQAANRRKTDPAGAKQLCRQIMAMVPQSHSMHQKAKKMLEEL